MIVQTKSGVHREATVTGFQKFDDWPKGKKYAAAAHPRLVRPDLTAYSKVYSRRYRAAGKYAGAHSGRNLTGAPFKAWSAAGQARRDYVEGNISGEEMLARVRVD